MSKCINVNIDSNNRQILDEYIIEYNIRLANDGLYSGTNNYLYLNLLHKNNIKINDLILIKGIYRKKYILTNELIEFTNGSQYVKINISPNIDFKLFDGGNLKSFMLTNIEVSISKIQGDYIKKFANDRFIYYKSTFIGFTSINEINKVHKIYVDYSNDYFYIKLNNEFNSNGRIFKNNVELVDITKDSENVVYIDQTATITFNSHGNIYYDDIETGSDKNNKYQIVKYINNNTIGIKLNYLSNNNDMFGGNNVVISKISSTVYGYDNPNNYRYYLKNTMTNIKSIKMISSEFPNTQFCVNDSCNKFTWYNFNDGDHLYEFTMPNGIYSKDSFIKYFEYGINKIPRIINYLETELVIGYNIFSLTIDKHTDIVTMTSYKKYNLYQPISDILVFDRYNNVVDRMNSLNIDKYTKNNIYIYKIVIRHNNHLLDKDDIITIQNMQSYLKIPTNVLNGTFTIDTVVNSDSYIITLQPFNFIDNINNKNHGGDIVSVTIPDKFMVIDGKNNLLKLLGFDTITNYYASTLNNANSANFVNLSGVNYILMQCNDYISIYDNKIDCFAKILLSGPPGNILFNTFVETEYVFDDVKNAISYLDIKFFNPDGTIYDFGMLPHSFTLQFSTI